MHRPFKKTKTNAFRNAEDVDIGASDSVTAPTEINSSRSNSSPTETNNSASNSLIAPTENCYEVFLSFRGPDTRQGFTDHLYHGLLNAGIHTFRDDDKLHHGEEIRPELMAAITNSKILIPIVSMNYGRSSSCLDELVQIMERKNNNGQMVLPIFYKVKPADVGYLNGSFGDAFKERERLSLGRPSFNPMVLEKWKRALLEVSKLKGYEANGYEAELVKLLVRKVLSELKKKFELVISENLVGIDSHVNNVMELLDNKSRAPLFVGIYGMGGIGKTTLAKTIYNRLSNQFEHRSFIADIRESRKHGIHYLQNQLIHNILNQENVVHNADDGINFISSRFKDKKVLLLLDDVDDDDQVKCLAGSHDWFSSGSRIIITSRNKKILEAREIPNYELRELDDDQSLILFSKHAFREDFPPSEFEGLAREVVSTTGGLPLSLEVLGSLLCGEESKVWRETIKKSKKVPHKEVQEKLRISYDKLEDEQKYIFLDIACFLIGTDSRIAFYMWEASEFFPGVNIDVLRFMSLIKIGDNHKLQMHDQLRDLGRRIVREDNEQQPWYHSRLWDSEEALKVLKRCKGTDKIEGIDLSKGSPEGFGKTTKQHGDAYEAKQFKELTSLRLLYMKGAHLTGDFKYSMEELKWLRWENCSINFEVNNFHVNELAVLELPLSKINEKWKGWNFFMMADKLKFLDLSYCEFLENTDFLSAFKELEVLILQECQRLKQIDSSIGDMEALLRLDLCQCTSLRELPVEIGKLKALERLLLRYTQSLSALPDSIGSLENLEYLDISGSGIEELPNSIGSLRKLQEFHAFNCSNLKGEMAVSMCNLSSLRHVTFGYCSNLQSLPNLPSSLTYLEVTCQCRKLPSLSHLTDLKGIKFVQCDFLECIPELPSTLLKNSECSQLIDVEELESPQSLNTPFKMKFLQVESCPSIKILDVSQFIHLTALTIQFCKNLLEVRGLDKLIYMEGLAIEYCGSIKWLDLSKFMGLKRLYTTHCKKLIEIQGLNSSEYLEMLHIQGCTSIERLNLTKSGRLKKLDARCCKNLAEIQGLNRLEFLEELQISRCSSIERLLLPKSGSLKTLTVGSFEKLVEIEGLDRLEYLEILYISRCTLIEGLLLPKSKSLKTLIARGCKNLVEIQGLDRLEFLEMLDISMCTSIERLLLPKSKSLKTLIARGYKNLVEIQGLDRLEFLEMLDMSMCTSIERLLLPKSKSLKELIARGCTNLIEIQGLDRLELLETLDISQCTSIRRLLLPKSKSLKELIARGCTNLTEIQGLEISKSLKILEATDCENLVEIQGLDRLEFLEVLNIIGCNSLKRIPELSKTRIYQHYETTDSETMESGSDYTDSSYEST